MNELEMMIQQSEDNVGEAMLSCLDKADMMLEYAGYDNDAVDEYIAELFDVFMEATARRKKADEIDEYMRKHNWGDVNAKTPAQAKKARQLRNFLIMQDFDPKTETIKSDDGSGRRIKFTINKMLGMNRKDTAYSGKHNAINLDMYQARSQSGYMLGVHHEKGHELFNADGRSSKWSDYYTDEDKSERGIKHIDETKAKGKKINSHDDGSYNTDRDGKQSPEELEADLHAAKTARVRTKYAGRKRAVKRSGATRHVTDKEIESWYINLHVKDGRINGDIISKYKLTTMPSFIKKLKAVIIKNESEKQFYEFLRQNEKQYSNFYYAMDTLVGTITEKSDDEIIHDTQQLRRLLGERKRLENKIDEDMSRINNYKREVEMSPGDEWYENQLKETKLKLEEDAKTLDDLLKKIESHAEASKTDHYKIIQYYYDYLVKPDFVREDESFEELHEHDKGHISEKFKKLKQNLNIFDEIIKMISSYCDMEKYKKEYKKAVKQALREYKINRSKPHPVELDDSKQMRHDFVKKYIHECFEEFMLDYYSYENVFGDYVED